MFIVLAVRLSPAAPSTVRTGTAWNPLRAPRGTYGGNQRVPVRTVLFVQRVQADLPRRSFRR
jgi:hypothetical protein